MTGWGLAGFAGDFSRSQSGLVQQVVLFALPSYFGHILVVSILSGFYCVAKTMVTKISDFLDFFLSFLGRTRGSQVESNPLQMSH